MRTWTLIAASLVLASAGAWAAALPGQQGSAGENGQRRVDKRIVVAEDGDEPALKALSLFSDRDVEIGVSIHDQDAEQTKGTTGPVVDDVRQDSPAARAGIKAGDIVVEFDGERVRSARHLSRLVEETAPGRAVKLALMREGKRIDVDVTPEQSRVAWFSSDAPNVHIERVPGMRPGDPAFRLDAPRMFEYGTRPYFHERTPGDDGDKGFDLLFSPGRGRLGIGVQDLTPQLAEYFGTKDGVLVTNVVADSPASKAGIRAGDVITAVNDAPVDSPSALIEAVGKASDGADVKLTYTRDKKAGSATAKLDPRPRPKRSTRPV